MTSKGGTMNESKTVIAYHQRNKETDCTDGLAAAWVARLRHPEANIQGFTYDGKIQPQLDKGDTIIIVDFSFPKSVMAQWQRQGINVVCLDHHESAERQLLGTVGHNWLQRLVWRTPKPTIRFDMNECGATLTWQHFFPGEPCPHFLRFIKDRDCWDWLLPESEEINEAIADLLYEQTRDRPLEDGKWLSFGVFDRLALMSEETLKAQLVPRGTPLVAKRKAIIDAIMASDRIRRTEVAGFPDIPTVTLTKDEDRHYSNVGTRIYRTFADAPFVLLITSDGGHHLRSDKHGKNENVALIAERLGGGGHRNSAGFPKQHELPRTV